MLLYWLYFGVLLVCYAVFIIIVFRKHPQFHDNAHDNEKGWHGSSPGNARSGGGSPRGDGWSEDGRGRAVTGPHPESGGEKRPAAVRVGVIMQSLSYLLAWNLRRPRLDPFGGTALWPDILIAAAGVSLALCAVILVAAAKKHLGRHWALAARVIDEHRLVTDGPFGRVRHPIYLAMGLLLLAAVVGLSSVPGAACASLFFVAGTYIRVRAEEGLLAREFGPEFEAYRRRVSAFLPRLRPRRGRPDKLGGGLA
jgi:protein-S-isoprenylcysteine O-methyltransferase Ste14